MFEKFVKRLQKKGIRVIFYLPPYHPMAYQRLMKNPKYAIINDVEKYTRLMASKNKIQVIGSYNPEHLNLSGEDFFDAIHAKEPAIKKIFTKNTTFFRHPLIPEQ